LKSKWRSTLRIRWASFTQLGSIIFSP
jgi:hypothetical protein